MLNLLSKKPNPIINNNYKTRVNFEQRKQISQTAMKAYPDMIPIVIQRAVNSTLPKLDSKQEKNIVKKTHVAGQIIRIIRGRLRERSKEQSSEYLSEYQAILIFIGEHGMIFPNTSDKMGDLYDKYADDDGNLYIYYCANETFG